VLIWRALVLLIDLYLIISVGPWVALRAIYAWILRGGDWPSEEEKRLARLIEGERAQSGLWPLKPRPGRYEEIDRQGQESLAALREVIRTATSALAAVGDGTIPSLGMREVALLGAWAPFLASVRIGRAVRILRHALTEGEERLAFLEGQHRAARDVPERMRGLLAEMTAELRRVQALYEAEREAGTLGIGEIEHRLNMTEARLTHALAQLEGAEAERLDDAVQFADAEATHAAAEIEEIDRLIGEVATTRQKARNLLERVESGLRLASQRWEALQARGAQDETIASLLTRARDLALHLMQTAKGYTVEAYQQVIAEAGEYDQAFQELSTALDRLDEMMRQSKEAIEGDVQRLAECQALCDGMTAQEPLLELDESTELIHQASEAYREAEHQRSLGTIEGYEQAIRLSQHAQSLLEQATAAATSVMEQVAEVRTLLEALSPEARAQWRERVEAAREHLAAYPAHWGAGLDSAYAEALAQLDAVNADLDEVPSDIRFQRALRQSELAAALEPLRRAARDFQHAQEIIAGLEREQERILTRREELERALERVNNEFLPDLRARSEEMLPELRERLETLELAYSEHCASFEDPLQLDYDYEVGEWLPSILREMDEIRLAHENDVQHYRLALRETLSAIDRQWARLMRLEPQRPPRPDEDVSQLAADLDAWREKAEGAQENPLAMRDLLGQEATALQRRIEATQNQIIEGRRTLETLARQYRRLSRSVQDLRSTVRTLRTSSPWPQLAWDDREAEALWEEATATQREADSAERLSAAISTLQRAVNLAEQAERAYGRLEYQMRTALTRLNEELAAVAGRLEKQQRLADQIRELGPSDDLAALDARNERVEALIDMARAATTMDDALRHLREAADVLSEA